MTPAGGQGGSHRRSNGPDSGGPAAGLRPGLSGSATAGATPRTGHPAGRPTEADHPARQAPGTPGPLGGPAIPAATRQRAGQGAEGSWSAASPTCAAQASVSASSSVSGSGSVSPGTGGRSQRTSVSGPSPGRVAGGTST